jgi:hypothetical protein
MTNNSEDITTNNPEDYKYRHCFTNRGQLEGLLSESPFQFVDKTANGFNRFGIYWHVSRPKIFSCQID